MATDTIQVIPNTYSLAGPPLGLIVPPRTALTDFRENVLSDLVPEAAYRTLILPDVVSVATKDGYQAVTKITNVYGQGRASAPDLNPRNAASVGGRFPIKSSASNGAPALLLPADNGTAAEPFVGPVPLEADANTFFLAVRCTNDGQADFLTSNPAAFGNGGPRLMKDSTTDFARFYYTASLFIASPASILNKWTFLMATHSAARGVSLYVNGALAGTVTSDEAKAAYTVLGYQLFSSGTGAGPGSGLWGLFGHLALDLSDPANAAIKTGIEQFALSFYPIGS